MGNFEQFQQTQLSQSNPAYIQEAIVKDNRDPKKMGRLKVWIVNSSSPEDNKSGWVTCDYATPFGGRTQGNAFANKFEDYPMSYGFWGVPPDINVRVFVFFVNGKMDKAYWFGCAYDYGMTNNVPAPKTKMPLGATIDTPLPITDYDRNTTSAPTDTAYPNVPLIDGLRKQRMLYDYDMSVADRSASRQAPYMVYGLNSPRGNHIVIDDGFIDGEDKAGTWDDGNLDEYQNTEQGSPAKDTTLGDRKYEGIMLRTRSGATLMISESKGNIFLINRDGTARIELDPDGNVTLLADRDVAIRGKRNVNVLAEGDYNVDVMGNYNLRVRGNYNQELSSLNISNSGAISWQASSSFNLQASSFSSNISGSLVLKGSSISLESGSAIAMSGGGTSMSVGGGAMQINGSLKATGDVTSSNVSLNNHTHPHGDPIVGAPIAGSGSTSAPAAIQSAASVSVSSMSASAYNDVVETETEASIATDVQRDIGKVSDKSLSALCFQMPVSGTIQKFGYWGENVTQLDGTTDNNSGWVIDVGSSDVDVVAAFNGVIKYSKDTLFAIDHQNGYTTVYDGVKINTDSKFKEGSDIVAGTAFGKAKNTVAFEIRKSTSSLVGFEGSVDPGLFYVEATSTSQEAASKQLTAGQTTNPICLIQNTSSYTSSGLVKITGVNTIITTLPLSGSLNDPSGGSVITSNTTNSSGQVKGAVLPDDQEPLKSDPTPMDWVVEANDAQLNKEITNDEGGKGIQTKLGYYRNGKYQVYRDTRGFNTIGIGHLVTAGENFGAGITDDECAALLQKDLIKHVRNAKAIAVQYNMKLPYQAQQVMVQACYQLGPGGLRKFKTFLSLLASGKYSAAADSLKSSAWYRQTPNRVNKHIAKLKGLGG